MNTLELIDRLCAVTAAQADIIREQAYFIENCKTIDEEVKKHFCFPKIEISCFSAFLLSDLYGFISRKKLYVAQNQEHSPSENDENAI